MGFVALALDYDGTIAFDGCVAPDTIEALRRFQASGRSIVLVTGRELDDLLSVFPQISLFDLVVAENGGLLYDSATHVITSLADAPPARLIARLQEDGVEPLSVGRVIVATLAPHANSVFSAIRDLRLELQIIFNKGAAMVLPSGIDKASGLKEALSRLGVSPTQVVAVGDAENDLPFLRLCGAAVAVGNALPAVRSECDLVVGDHGSGIVELCNMLLANDLDRLTSRLKHAPEILPRTLASRDVRSFQQE